MTDELEDGLGRVAKRLSVDQDSRGYWLGCLERRLRIQRCGACRAWTHFPVPACPECHSTATQDVEVSGDGQIYTFVVDRGSPHGFALVELDDAPHLKIPAPIVDCAPSQLSIGQRVGLVWLEWDGLSIPAFAPKQTA